MSPPPLRARGVGPALRSAIAGFRLPDLLLVLVCWGPLLFAWSPYLISFPALAATYGGPFELSVLLGETAARMVRTPHPYFVTWIPLGLAGLALRQFATALILRRIVASRAPPPRTKAVLRIASYTVLTILCLGFLNAVLPPTRTPLWIVWAVIIGFAITRYALVLPVLVAEDGSVRHALRRSAELTKQSRIGVFLVQFWIVVVPAVVLFVAALFEAVDGPGPPVAAVMVLYAFAAVFQAGFLGFLYRQTAGRESESMVRVFD